MTPLPAALGGSTLTAWRLDQAIHADSWNTGEGAFRVGGRWNTKGRRVVYCALDPATAILEVAVHKGFRALDVVPHTLTAFEITQATDVHIVQPGDVPNPHWLHPGIPTTGQQEFGNALLDAHHIVVIPSVVSTHSWNLLFDPTKSAGRYQQMLQERFALDPRLA